MIIMIIIIMYSNNIVGIYNIIAYIEQFDNNKKKKNNTYNVEDSSSECLD